MTNRMLRRPVTVFVDAFYLILELLVVVRDRRLPSHSLPSIPFETIPPLDLFGAHQLFLI